MHNVAPSRALARRSRQLLVMAFVIATVGIFIAVIGIAMYVINLAAPESQSFRFFSLVRVVVLIIGVVTFLIALGIGIRAVTVRKDNDLAMITGRFLTRYLDARYHFIRNISKRGLGYIDAVLVGPPGVLVFRILNNRGSFANEAAHWLKQDARGGWTTAGIEPTREAVEDIRHLREYLAERKLGDVPVYGIIVFTKEEPAVHLTAKEPVVPITTLASLVTNLGSSYLAKERIDAGKVTAIVRLLYDV